MWQLEMVWGSLDGLFFWSTLQAWLRDTCKLALGGNTSVPRSGKLLLWILSLKFQLSTLVCLSSPPQCSDLQELCRYSQNVSPSQLIGLLCVLSTLTYWGFHFLACCVSKSSTGVSGIVCALPSQSLSDGEVLFLSLWPNNSNWCQSGGEKKWGD